jgi:hypothetical protein
LEVIKNGHPTDMLEDQRWTWELGDRGILSPGRCLWMRAAGWNLVLFAGAIFFFFATLMQFLWLHLPGHASLRIAVLGPLLAFVVYALAVKAGERRWPRELIPSSSIAFDLLAGSLIGVAMIVSTLLLLWALGLYNIQGGHLKHWFSFLVFDSYVSSMLEELAFRGILLKKASVIQRTIRAGHENLS